MHNQDPTGTHKRGKKKKPGLKCPKCGWSFPIQYPTPKAKRDHNEICGTIEGYILEVEQKEGDGLNPSVGAERVDEQKEGDGLNPSVGTERVDDQKEGDGLNPSVGAERVDEKEGSSVDNKGSCS